jgi:hypothetical protein
VRRGAAGGRRYWAGHEWLAVRVTASGRHRDGDQHAGRRPNTRSPEIHGPEHTDLVAAPQSRPVDNAPDLKYAVIRIGFNQSRRGGIATLGGVESRFRRIGQSGGS